MNWVDLSFVATTLSCALAAGAVAVDKKMGWASLLFAIGGLSFGFGFGFAARWLGAWLLFRVSRQPHALATFAMLIAYLIVPMIIFFAAILATRWLTVLVASNFLSS